MVLLLSDRLVDDTLTLFHQESVDSTNDWAWRHYQAERPQLPCLFTATHQTQGRGAGQGRRWYHQHQADESSLPEAASNLAMSVLLPHVSSEWVFSQALPKWAAVITFQVLTAGWPGLPLHLKGINDLTLTHGPITGKCGGILVETRWRQPDRSTCPVVVGIGLNLHTAPTLLDALYPAMALASCLSDHERAQLNAPDLANVLAHHLCHSLDQLTPAVANQHWLSCKANAMA